MAVASSSSVAPKGLRMKLLLLLGFALTSAAASSKGLVRKPAAQLEEGLGKVTNERQGSICIVLQVNSFQYINVRQASVSR